METQKIAVGYIRVSTSIQSEEGISLSTQTNKINEYCKYKGMTIRQFYEDAGISGGTSNRPALQDMLTNLRKGEYIICADLSRLSRNSNDAINILKSIKDKGGFLVSLNPDIDFSTSIGELMYTILFAFYQLERKQISERVSANLNTLSRTHQLRSKAPFGWKFVGKDKPFEVDEDQVGVLEYILELHDKGFNLNQISIKLNEEGYAVVLKNHALGQVFDPQKIKNILIDHGRLPNTLNRKPLDKKYFDSRNGSKS